MKIFECAGVSTNTCINHIYHQNETLQCQHFHYLGAKYTWALRRKVECWALQLDSTNTIMQTKDFKFLNASCCKFLHPAVDACLSYASICTSVQKQYIHFKQKKRHLGAAGALAHLIYNIDHTSLSMFAAESRPFECLEIEGGLT